MYNQNLNIFYDYNHMNDFVYHLYALYCFTTKMIQVSRASICSFFLSFFFFMATPAAYGDSQALSSWSCSHRPIPEPQQRGIWAAFATYTTSHSNAGSLSRWVRLGIEPTSSWMLVGFVNHWATMGTHVLSKATTVSWKHMILIFESSTIKAIMNYWFCILF